MWIADDNRCTLPDDARPGVELSLAVRAECVPFWEEVIAEWGDDLKAIWRFSQTGWVETLEHPGLVADGAAGAPVELGVRLDSGGQDVLVLSDELAGKIWIHGDEVHGSIVASGGSPVNG